MDTIAIELCFANSHNTNQNDQKNQNFWNIALQLYSLFLGLQMADVDLDARITALEENGGSDSQNGILTGQCN